MRVNGHKHNSDLMLDRLSTQELERLLYTPEGEEPDTELISDVLEVIMAREAEETDAPAVDVDAAWEDFKERCMEQDEACALADEEPQNKKLKTGNHSVLVLLRRFAAAVAVLILMCGTASAFGLDIFHWLASWTAETFRFSGLDDLPISQDIPEEDPYQDLRAAVAEETDLPVVPTRAPFEAAEEVTVTQRLDSVFIHGEYKSEDKEYTISVIVYDSIDLIGTDSIFLKDDSIIDRHEINHIEHYVMKNYDHFSCVWHNENVQVQIQGSLTPEDLESMIASVYWE
ncbi:MAG: DUF4367 domain-containing protein [Oscillospiraceae bacterium]|nr:DUF4367 domain-containing protein [Oscillospiraceae bacterium]